MEILSFNFFSKEYREYLANFEKEKIESSHVKKGVYISGKKKVKLQDLETGDVFFFLDKGVNEDNKENDLFFYIKMPRGCKYESGKGTEFANCYCLNTDKFYNMSEISSVQRFFGEVTVKGINVNTFGPKNFYIYLRYCCEYTVIKPDGEEEVFRFYKINADNDRHRFFTRNIAGKMDRGLFEKTVGENLYFDGDGARKFSKEEMEEILEECGEITITV